MKGTLKAPIKAEIKNVYTKEYFNNDLTRTKPITYSVQPVGGYLIFVYNYGSAAVFLVRGEYTTGFIHRLAPVNDRNAFSCKWENSALTITSSDDASATVSIIRLY